MRINYLSTIESLTLWMRITCPKELNTPAERAFLQISLSRQSLVFSCMQRVTYQQNLPSRITTVRTSKGVIVIRSFLQKCGLVTTHSGMSSHTGMTIEQEIAKLSSIPEDGHEFTSFWQASGREMPQLAMVARKSLCICGTSVPRIFSQNSISHLPYYWVLLFIQFYSFSHALMI